MSNQSDYSWAISQLKQFIKENDISEIVINFKDNDIFKLRKILHEYYPRKDFWYNSEWDWLGRSELETLIKSKGKQI